MIQTSLEKKISTYITEKARTTIAKLANDDLRKSFANALKKSIQLDDKNPLIPNPISVQQIYDQYGFDGYLQKEYFISLNRQQAKIFLDDMGYPVKPSSFDKKYNKPSYVERFKREPFVYGTRQIVITYAEWIHFVDLPSEPIFPEFLNQYL